MSSKVDFPFFVEHPKNIYLDNASTTQKPNMVLEAMTNYYVRSNSNIDGYYQSSIQSIKAIEISRTVIGNFLGVESEQVVFTPSATHSSNLITQGLKHLITQTDTIVICEQDHHSNIVPFIELSAQTQASLTSVCLREDGTLNLIQFESVLTAKPFVVAVSHISNVTGVINPIHILRQMIDRVSPNTILVVDISQSIGHMDIKPVIEDSDYAFFSGHKIYGPQGIGILVGKKHALAKLTPSIVGGKMISTVSSSHYTVLPSPKHLETGTPNIAGMVGLAAALRYHTNNHNYLLEQQLLGKAIDIVKKIGGIIISDMVPKLSLFSFVIPGVSPSDIGMILAKHNISVRTGMHCAIPLHTALKLDEGTVRVSLASYTTQEDIEQFEIALTASLNLLK
jgi:selenocysteine lyase/cysteine desulfurase